MPTYNKPGVYVQETLNTVQPVANAGTGTSAVFIGVTDHGPTATVNGTILGVPTLVTSWNDFLNKFSFSSTLDPFKLGEVRATATTAASASHLTTNSLDMKYAVKSFFDNGGNQAYILRQSSTGTSAAAATLTITDGATTPTNVLIVTAKSVGQWGNGVWVQATPVGTDSFDLTVYYNETVSTSATVTGNNRLEQYAQLSMDPNSPRYAPVSVLSNYVTVTAATTATPTTLPKTLSGTTPAAVKLSGGAEGVAFANLATTLTQIDNVSGPVVINVPGNGLYSTAGVYTVNGATSTTIVPTLLDYAAGRQDAFVVNDGFNAVTVSNILTELAGYSNKDFGASYYPNIVIKDPTSRTGGTKAIYPGGAVVAAYLNSDNQRGAFQSPAGIGARVADAVSVPSVSTADFTNISNAGGILNVIRFVPGAGICIMGARTMSTDYLTKYVSVRRSLQFIERTIIDSTQYAVFEPNDSTLWGRVRSTIDSFLYGYWKQGGLYGDTVASAYYVKCDADNNTEATIANGELNVEVGVALQRPAEFVIIKIGQKDGGVSVVTSV